MKDRRLGVVLILGMPAALSAQTGTLIGRVVRDSVAQGLAGVEVRLPAVGVSATENVSGEFRFDCVLAGPLIVTIRHPGFRPVQDTVVIRSGDVTDRRFRLTPLPVELDSMRVVAKSVEYISANLRGFRDRQQSKSGGYFVDDSVLRRNENDRLPDVLASRIPSLTIIRDRSAAYFSSGRNASFSDGPIFGKRPAAKSASDIQVTGCWVSVYVDGIVVYGGGSSSSTPPDAYVLEARNCCGPGSGDRAPTAGRGGPARHKGPFTFRVGKRVQTDCAA